MTKPTKEHVDAAKEIVRNTSAKGLPSDIETIAAFLAVRDARRTPSPRVALLERVAEAADVWRTHHVCCPKDCPDLKMAQKNLGDALDALSAAPEEK